MTVTVPKRREGESELEYLRRKEVCFGLWQGDMLERIHDLESDLERADADRAKYRTTLMQVHAALGIVGKYAMLQADEISTGDFARDFVPWQNIMAHAGIEPYAKPKRSRNGAETEPNAEVTGA